MGRGRGRAPCCDKSKVKKGPWSLAEDTRLITFIGKYGHDNWRSLPKQAGLLRCGKSCRLRWINYLSPDVKRGNFSPEEEQTILKLHQSFGNKWSKIASHLPGRTDNEIKNVWNTQLKKRLLMKDANLHGDIESNKESSMTSSSSSYMSCNNQNMGNGVGYQEAQGSVFGGTHGLCDRIGGLEKEHDSLTTQRSPTDEMKEASCSPSSISSCTLNLSNSSIQVDDSRPTEEMSELCEVNDQDVCILDEVIGTGHPLESDDDFWNISSLCEVNNQDVRISDEVIGIGNPLESDYDFWNMLPNLDSFLSNEAPLQEFQATQNSNFREECDREIECRKWLRYLEKELELEAVCDGDHHHSPLDAADRDGYESRT